MLAEDRARDEVAAGEPEHVAVARVAAATQTPSRPGTRPTSGSRSGVVPQMPAQRCVIARRVADERAATKLLESRSWTARSSPSTSVSSVVEASVALAADHEPAVGQLLPVVVARRARSAGRS